MAAARAGDLLAAGDPADDVGGVPDLGEAAGDRRWPQPEPVRGAEVADHPGLGERLVELDGPRVMQADVRPAARGIARRGEAETQRGQPGVRELDQVAGEAHSLVPQRPDARLGQQAGALGDGGDPGDVGGAGHEPADAGDRVVGRPHGELVLLAEPALHRLVQLFLQVSPDIEERGRPGAGVEVLVGAPDRQVGAAPVEVHRHRAGGVAQIPQHQRAAVVRDAGDLCHVGQGAAAVGHMRQAEQRGPLVHGVTDRLHAHPVVDVGVDHAQLPAVLTGDTGQHVPVGGEVVVVGHDDAAAGAGIEGGTGQLVQVDRGVVADQYLAGRRAQQVMAEQVARLAWQGHPAAPGPDQPPPPAAPDHLADPLRGCQRQHAQRVAVQVDQRRVVAHETVVETGQRIGGITFLRERPVERGVRHTPHTSSGAFVARRT